MSNDNVLECITEPQSNMSAICDMVVRLTEIEISRYDSINSSPTCQADDVVDLDIIEFVPRLFGMVVKQAVLAGVKL